MVDPREESVELVAPRPAAWRAAFEAERTRIHEVLEANGLTDARDRVVHVGSTAVPDLWAKDIVDLDVVVADDAVGPVSRAIADELGGDRFENTDRWHPVFRAVDGQRFNDHVFGVSSDKWKVSVVTRDVLRARPAVRAEYEELKRELAAQHDEKEAYSKAKTEFLGRALRTARDADDLAFDFEVPDEP